MDLISIKIGAKQTSLICKMSVLVNNTESFHPSPSLQKAKVVFQEVKGNRKSVNVNIPVGKKKKLRDNN